MAKKKISSQLYLTFGILFFIGLVLGLIFNLKIEQQDLNIISKPIINLIKYEPTNFNNVVGISNIKIPAVDSNGNGVVTNLLVEVTKGSGKTLVDIDSILFIADTQSSIRTAKDVAAEITGKDVNKYDIIYHLDANASVIGGPSAGASLTLATIAAINNVPLREDIMITGGISSDGTITEVGGILDKAKASKAAGAKVFLVPETQSEEIVYEDKESCRKVGLRQICTIEQIPRLIDVEEEAGITVKEVKNIEEAYKYFFISN